jgi:hypothetical protein
MIRAARFIVVLVALLVALPIAPAHAAVPGGPQTICIDAHALIKPHHHVHVGDEVAFYGDWFNCGRRVYMRFVFGIHAPSHCEGLGYHSEFHFRLRKGDGIGEAVGERVDCSGVYRVTAKAYHDGKLIGRASRWVRVLP